MQYQQAFEFLGLVIGIDPPKGQAAFLMQRSLEALGVNPDGVRLATREIASGDFWIASKGFPSVRDIARAHRIASEKSFKSEREQAKAICDAVYGRRIQEAKGKIDVNWDHIKRIYNAKQGDYYAFLAKVSAYLDDPTKIDRIAPLQLEKGNCEKPVNEDPEAMEEIRKLFKPKENENEKN